MVTWTTRVHGQLLEEMLSLPAMVQGRPGLISYNNIHTYR